MTYNHNHQAPRRQQPLVLIVDDTPPEQQPLTHILQAYGFEVRLVHDGQSALNQAKGLVPDIILLDIVMPGLDGLATCRCLKLMPELASIPVIFLTARSSSEDIVNGLRAGAVDYLAKPYSIPEILARINTHLELKFSKDHLHHALATIEKISEERRELLHVLCHDLANPVNSIIATLKISKSKPGYLTEQIRDEMLKVASHSMDVINLVRKIRAFEDGKYELEIEDVNLLDAVNHAVLILTPRLQQKNISISIDIPAQLRVIAEKTSLLNSVLNNILTNSIKFSLHDSHIKVAADDGDDMAYLHIRDEGIGMDRNIIDSIFHIGPCHGRKGTAGETGTGYGMPLAKRFMDAFGGNISIHSRPIHEYPDSHGTDLTLAFKKYSPN